MCFPCAIPKAGRCEFEFSYVVGRESAVRRDAASRTVYTMYFDEERTSLYVLETSTLLDLSPNATANTPHQHVTP